MSFFINFRSDKCPGVITGNPSNGLYERVCLQADKVFDACIKQTQIENAAITLTPAPAATDLPLTFVSARSSSSAGTISNLNVERAEKGCSRVQCTVSVPLEVIYTDTSGTESTATSTISVNADVLLYIPAQSIMPYSISATVSAVAPQGTYNSDTQGFTISACVTVILRVIMPVDILLPSYGYCSIPPAQEYSQEVCSGFFELPLYPQGKSCSRN